MAVATASGDHLFDSLGRPAQVPADALAKMLVTALAALSLAGLCEAPPALAALDAQTGTAPPSRASTSAQSRPDIAYADSRDFAVLVRREPAGQLKLKSPSPRTFESHYHFSDNGRGPALQERWIISPSGIPIDYSAQGNSTFGAL